MFDRGSGRRRLEVLRCYRVCSSLGRARDDANSRDQYADAGEAHPCTPAFTVSLTAIWVHSLSPLEVPGFVGALSRIARRHQLLSAGGAGNNRVGMGPRSTQYVHRRLMGIPCFRTRDARTGAAHRELHKSPTSGAPRRRRCAQAGRRPASEHAVKAARQVRMLSRDRRRSIRARWLPCSPPRPPGQCARR
jgi:hypothetical protein